MPRRDWRNWIALTVLAILFIATLYMLNETTNGGTLAKNLKIEGSPWVVLLLAGLAIVLGVSLVRSFVDWLVRVTGGYLGTTRARGAGIALNIVLYFLLVLIVAGQTRINLSGVALSGAVTGVVVGIAAQASLSNIVAGVVILFARPYRPGLFVTVRAAAFAGGEYSGEVEDITLLYTTLHNGAQEIRVPNSSMVASVVVIRPQALDIYLPLVLPLNQWEVLSTTGLVHQLSAALPAERLVTATVERIADASVQIAVRASVASDTERATLERALVQVMRSAHASDEAPTDLAEEIHRT